MDNSYGTKAAFVRNEAKKLGFCDVGFSRAESIPDHSQKLAEWLSSGYHGGMDYMANNLDKRNDPRLLVEGARTIISLSYNYFTKTKQADPKAPIISQYALGRDYHKVLNKKLKVLNLNVLHTKILLTLT